MDHASLQRRSPCWRCESQFFSDYLPRSRYGQGPSHLLPGDRACRELNFFWNSGRVNFFVDEQNSASFECFNWRVWDNIGGTSPFIMSRNRIGELYKEHFRDSRRERLFLSSLSFFIAFGIARAIAYSIRRDVGPLHSVYIHGTHIHHLVFGIFLLLITGYLWLAQVGIGINSTSRWVSRITAIFYGIGAALTLDEFALWLNLKDVYWTGEGRQSVDAIILFGAVLFVGLCGVPFFRALSRYKIRSFRR